MLFKFMTSLVYLKRLISYLAISLVYNYKYIVYNENPYYKLLSNVENVYFRLFSKTIAESIFGKQ